MIKVENNDRGLSADPLIIRTKSLFSSRFLDARLLGRE